MKTILSFALAACSMALAVVSSSSQDRKESVVEQLERHEGQIATLEKALEQLEQQEGRIAALEKKALEPAAPPKIDYRIVEIPLTRRRGSPQPVTGHADFRSEVLHAWYAVEAFDVRFSSTEKEIKLVNYTLTDFSYSGRRVSVTGHVAIKDNSGSYDDDYEGKLKVRVFAMLK